MFSTIVGLVLGFVARLVNDWLSNKRAEQTLREKGALEASDETKEVITDVADKQAANNARDADVSDIADELQREADRAEGGGDSKAK